MKLIKTTLVSTVTFSAFAILLGVNQLNAQVGGATLDVEVVELELSPREDELLPGSQNFSVKVTLKNNEDRAFTGWTWLYLQKKNSLGGWQPYAKRRRVEYTIPANGTVTKRFSISRILATTPRTYRVRTATQVRSSHGGRMNIAIKSNLFKVK